MSLPEWVQYDLRCYSCDADLWLSDSQSEWYCSHQCSITVPLTTEVVHTFKVVLHQIGVAGYLALVGTLAVADAMLEPHPHRGGGRPGKSAVWRDQPDGLRSFQWRTIRLQQLESLVPV